jgi:DNA-binding GntR family transcriptional regulator
MSKLAPITFPERLSEKVYQTLRTAILNGGIPPGNLLAEGELASQLQVSRTPVREALRQLAAERLITLVAKGRFEVMQPTIQNVRELYECRMAVEGMAARLAAERSRGADPILEETLDGMTKAYQTADLAAVRDWNTRFHERLVQLAENLILAELSRNIQARVLLVRSVMLQVHVEPRNILDQHRDIAGAVAARDGDRAETLTRQHIGANLDVVLSALGMPATAPQ